MFLSNFLSNLTLSRWNAFIWDSKIKNLKLITHFRFIDLDLLIGIEGQKKLFMIIRKILPKEILQIMPCYGDQEVMVKAH